jgi:hypothetical protein
VRKGSIYDGRILDGEPMVRVRRPDGVGSPLSLRTDLRNHSPSGHAWGYSGSGPAQLALDMLADHFEIPLPSRGFDWDPDTRRAAERVYRIYQEFKRVFACMGQDQAWRMTSDEVDDLRFAIEAYAVGEAIPRAMFVTHAERAVGNAERAAEEAKRNGEQAAADDAFVAQIAQELAAAGLDVADIRLPTRSRHQRFSRALDRLVDEGLVECDERQGIKWYRVKEG